MAVRVYVPATLESLADAVSLGSIARTAERYVVADPDETEEAAEYDALMSAADASAQLPGSRRSVVVVAEVDDPDGPVPMVRVVAVHADTEDAADPDGDLGWFAVLEFPDLLGPTGIV
jgi:uncharacterized protein YggE